MNKKPELLFFDSNVYIHLLRSQEYFKDLEKFLQGAYLYVINKIVLMELWAGVKTHEEEEVLKLHQEQLPLIGLTDDNFILAGQILAQLKHIAKTEPKVRRRLTWDILIALSAKENNALLLTENQADFKKIKQFVDFEFMSVGNG